jgi:hypothetical protein
MDATGSNHSKDLPHTHTFGPDNGWGSADDALSQFLARSEEPSRQNWGYPGDALSQFLARSEEPSQGHWGYPGDALDQICGNQGDIDDHLDHMVLPTSASHYDSTDALERFLQQFEHLSDHLSDDSDTHAPMMVSPSATQLDPSNLPEISTLQVDFLDIDGAGGPGSALCSESSLQSTGYSDVDGGSDYESSTYEPLSKPPTPVSRDHSPLPRCPASDEELYIGKKPVL